MSNSEIEPAHRHPDLIKPDRRAATGVDEQLLVTSLNERARPKPIGTRSGHSRPEQRHAEIA